jgi:two-component sensor histidine kinase
MTQTQVLVIAPANSSLRHEDSLRHLRQVGMEVKEIESLMDLNFSLSEIDVVALWISKGDDRDHMACDLEAYWPLSSTVVVLENGANAQIELEMKCRVAEIHSSSESLEVIAQALRRCSVNRHTSIFELPGELLAYSLRYKLTSREMALNTPSCSVVKSLYELGRITLEEKLKITIAIQEALMNALEHGNLELPSGWKSELDAQGNDKFSVEKSRRLTESKYAERAIWVSHLYDGISFVTTVCDEGNGYPINLPTHQSLSKNLTPSGRGLALITWAFDRIQFNDKGNEITMIKQLTR